MMELQEQGATTKLVPSVLQASSVGALPPEDEMWRMVLGDIWAAALLESDKKKRDEEFSCGTIPHIAESFYNQKYVHSV